MAIYTPFHIPIHSRVQINGKQAASSYLPVPLMCTSLLNNPLSEAPQVHIIQEHSWRSPVVELDHMFFSIQGGNLTRLLRMLIWDLQLKVVQSHSALLLHLWQLPQRQKIGMMQTLVTIYRSVFFLFLFVCRAASF
jgi:hypothetical protein